MMSNEEIINLLWNALQLLTKDNYHKPWHNPQRMWRDCQVCHDTGLYKKRRD